MSSEKIVGLVAAVHTPFDHDGKVNLDVVERQAAHLIQNQVQAIFVCGTTGESHSLSVDERKSIVNRWSRVISGTSMKLIVHVGSNALVDAQELARHAAASNAWAISSLAPSYFKPANLDRLIDCMASVASAAPNLPFYFYDIPVLTHVAMPMPEFLERAAGRIPNLRGAKFTNSDLMAYQLCLHADHGRWDVPFGCDEYLLAALALGGQGAVGSTYNFAAPVYHAILHSFNTGDLATARMYQLRSVRLVQLLSSFGYMAAAKSVMNQLDVPVGGPRLPFAPLTDQQEKDLRDQLEKLGFFDWIQHG